MYSGDCAISGNSQSSPASLLATVSVTYSHYPPPFRMASILSSLPGRTKLYAYYYVYLLTALIIHVILAGVIYYH